MLSEDSGSELDSYQLYHRYEEPRPEKDWKRAALAGPALPALGNALAGAVGSALSNVATYPLSLIVARLQTQRVRGTNKESSNTDAGGSEKKGQGVEEEEEEDYTGVIDAARKIYAQEGIAAFYTGLAQDTFKSVADSFLFFLAYEFFRQRRIRARFGNTRRSKHTVLPVLDELAVGVLAGAFAKLFTTPLANIVARKQTSKSRAGTKEIAARIRAEKGLRGFWSGYSASLILTLNPSITFFLNEVLKFSLLKKDKRQRPSAMATFLLAALSKSAASSVTYPFSMAKTRAQVAGNQPSSADGGAKQEDEGISLTPAIIGNVLAIARTEGMATLYAGLPGEVLKGFFSHGFTMLAKDAVYSAIVKSYYLLLVALRRYPTPEELLQRAREQAEEYADTAREGARDLAEKARSGTEEILSHQTGSVTVDMTSSETGDVTGSNETAEMVGDYVEDEGDAKDLYHWFWEKENVFRFRFRVSMMFLTGGSEPRSTRGSGAGSGFGCPPHSLSNHRLFTSSSSFSLFLDPFLSRCLPQPHISMSAEPHSSPLGDLEKELTCSICTDLLYQPLTLLNCLHTFCGSCLKEWFSAQASRPSSSVRFTCPSCRAGVRETRPNATVTTLLDMIITATPDKDRPDAEKEEIARRYKPGDSVFPALPAERSPAGSDDEDRRLMQEVRELSLQESRARTTTTTGQRSRQSSRSRRNESTDRDASSRRRREEDRAARRQRPAPARLGEDLSERTRRIEHQSSLRSLLSLSDTETMQEEILRQIFEEGLLDDIDLDNLGPSQEEELSERIADAYRRRHRLRSRSQQRLEHDARQAASQSRPRSQSMQRPQDTATPRESARNPPVSRPYLLDPLVSRNEAPGHHRRLSEQGSAQRRTSPVAVNPASSSEVTLRPAARSSSDMVADRPRNSQAARVRAAESSTLRSRRATASERTIPNIWVENSRERAIRRAPGRVSIDSPRVVASPDYTRNGSWPASPEVNVPATGSLSAQVGGPSRPESRSRPSSSRSNAPPRSAISFTEPSISCDRCSKPNIQYELHKKCLKCKDGEYYLCLRCYRTGRGCLDWPGFGASAEESFERILASSNGQPQPSPESQQHILLSCKYRRAPSTAYRSDRDGRVFTTDDPARRLQTGLFCDSCHSPADDCYWKCDQCNEGDWGFCNRCVNQGRCCTHALLPICRIAPESASPTVTTNSNPSTETYKILSIATNCDICAHPIPDSTPRFHCLQCNDGDYDVCTNCYIRLVAIGKIRKENGHNGWRRCLKGHRMAVIGFDDHDQDEQGQRRIIVHDLVGGRALNDDHLQPSPTAAATPSPLSPHIQQTIEHPNVASPELGSGDWSWKEGTERRKKASRFRPWTVGDRDRDRDRDRTSEPSTPTPTAASFNLSSNINNTNNPAASSPIPSRRFPPNGGVGLVLHALWSWYPEDGVQDELMFPRGAEITEAENINEDWYWGCYAGLTGLFPGSHVFVAAEVV
ncbi:hypothetical protein BO70DRAFT_382034 [Aspergillus heteromorphus CBS 117.55]|uniref:RING-type domain-containing protein n=1 Tax=Aspergillus heteromorphus CBS 117.55 TaxID=1448321 RepID=A0A317VFQ1_9EURO|nr:uncharacterized protein BO70DRAFT_382034 [Aspergillus heteromorphus CBS 117.55]PWY71722.1 hypothetical protein BO70DRAFT_382034 [Aspergillus heteromorphus CBS 117.55]